MFNGVVDPGVVGGGRVFQPLSFLCDFWFCLTALGFHGWCGGRVGDGHCLKLWAAAGVWWTLVGWLVV